MPKPRSRPARKSRKAEGQWLWATLLVLVVGGVIGLQWLQRQQMADQGIPLELAQELARQRLAEEAAATDPDRPVGTPGSASAPSGGSARMPTAPGERPQGVFQRGNRIEPGGLQTAAPLATPEPLAGPRQIGGERLPEPQVSRELTAQAAEDPLCQGLQKQREEAEAKLRTQLTPAEQRTWRNERDTAIQNLANLGCFGPVSRGR